MTPATPSPNVTDLSDSHFRAICEHADDMIMVTEAAPLEAPGPAIVYINPAGERITGHRRRDLVGKTPRVLQGAETDRAQLDRVRAQLEKGERVHETLLNYRADGAPYWVEMSVHPLYDDMGTLTHFVAVEREVTEATHLQHVLSRQAAFLHTVIDNAFEGIVAMRAMRDEQERVVDFQPTMINSAAERILGIEGEAFKNQTLLMSFPGHTSSGMFDSYRQCVEHQTPAQFEIYYPHEGLDGYFLISARNVGDDLIVTFVDITERRHYEQNLEASKADAERRAREDALTGLPNSTQFFERGEQMRRYAEREGKSVFVLFIDLNGFKPINDMHGHDVGDQILIRLARRLARTARQSDVVSRLGGDEFAVVGTVPADRAEEDALRAGRRLLRELARPYHFQDGTTIEVGAAVGAALLPRDGADLQEGLQVADRAMYRAKAEGELAAPVFDRSEPHKA